VVIEVELLYMASSQEAVFGDGSGDVEVSLGQTIPQQLKLAAAEVGAHRMYSR